MPTSIRMMTSVAEARVELVLAVHAQRVADGRRRGGAHEAEEITFSLQLDVGVVALPQLDGKQQALLVGLVLVVADVGQRQGLASDDHVAAEGLVVKQARSTVSLEAQQLEGLAGDRRDEAEAVAARDAPGVEQPALAVVDDLDDRLGLGLDRGGETIADDVVEERKRRLKRPFFGLFLGLVVVDVAFGRGRHQLRGDLDRAALDGLLVGIRREERRLLVRLFLLLGLPALGLFGGALLFGPLVLFGGALLFLGGAVLPGGAVLLLGRLDLDLDLGLGAQRASITTDVFLAALGHAARGLLVLAHGEREVRDPDEAFGVEAFGTALGGLPEIGRFERSGFAGALAEEIIHGRPQLGHRRRITGGRRRRRLRKRAGHPAGIRPRRLEHRVSALRGQRLHARWGEGVAPALGLRGRRGWLLNRPK